MRITPWLPASILILGNVLWLSACSPTVKVQAPDKPITVDLNVKVAHEVNVKVSKEVEEMMKKNPDLF